MDTPALPYDGAAFAAAADALSAALAQFAARGWTPATSSNFSMRLDPDHLAITVSGRDKGRLGRDDFMVVDLDGQGVATDARPSAETALHTSLYRRYPEVGCVLHTHSIAQTVASRLHAPDGHVEFAGYELQKAIAGQSSHEGSIRLPVLANSQDMAELSAAAEAALDADPAIRGYLIEGHGLYAWGRDLAEARRHLEAYDFLLSCELELRRLTP